MNPVAIINGVKVFSTKQVNQINNTRVVFADGSWCDVETNEIVNNGPGTISLGTPSSGTPANNKLKKVGPLVFNGRAVDINGISADVDIAVGDKLSIMVEGAETGVDAIRFAQSGERLIVVSNDVSGRDCRSGMNISNGRGGIFISGAIRGSHVVATGGNINIFSISGGKGSSSTKVSITVPRGCQVSAQNIDGKTTIGDTEGPVQASVRGDGDFSIGKIGDATLSIQGGGDISVANVNGNLNVNVQGSGDVHIKNGAVRNLSVNVMGSGDVKFGGKAENASLSVVGSGDIDVTHVTNRPSMQAIGSGDISVGNW